MKTLFLVLIAFCGLVIVAGQTAAAPYPAGLEGTVSGIGEPVDLVAHRCYPSRCWCDRRGNRACTRDCRRDRHCRWVRDRASPCGRSWRCVPVRRPRVYRPMRTQ